ncbi:hypothetical protein QTH90_23825 [Variovorax sp. J2P1-59]|uniref:hypothetical protein n=1 Tax=Variovorax flavidus TaxID=3053501 RepID=UPI002575DC9F|nr:hypothetical protein [Variovorax sp. J2P1-59]MDM0077457.1 hypothetical protein [Variovorax sp. J2P1-59]
MVVDVGDVDFAEPAAARRWPHYQVQREDLVLNVTGAGSVGRVGIYFGTDQPLTNQHLAKLSVASAADAAFVCAFLSSWWGERALEQGISGSTGQLNLVNDHIRQVPVFTPDLAAQRYIGDKVRQAERLRQRARRLEACFREKMAVAVPETSPTAGKTSRVKSGELGRNLNPGVHTPDRRAVRAAVQAAGGRALDTLGHVESPTTDSFSPRAVYVGLDAIDSVTCVLKPSTAEAEAVAGMARLLREGPALSRLRPYLNKVTYIPQAFAGGIGSTELFLVRPKEGVDGWFLYGVLKLESSVRQLNPIATGSTHPRVDREDVLELLVPWRDDQQALGALLRMAQACYFASAELTEAATALVEHLIEGRVVEADLVAAQKALEVGDRNADCEILKALRQSDAPGAKALIADVDALCALINASEEEAA